MKTAFFALVLAPALALAAPKDAPKKSAKVTEIQGIGDAFAKKLEDAGIKTTDELLTAAGPVKGRADLALKTGISEVQLLKWANRADLARIKGIGGQFAELLEAAGVDSTAELAQRNPANLAAKLKEVNKAKKLSGNAPTEKQVTAWIETAKTLPKVVTH